jgi:hypothetical protein
MAQLTFAQERVALGVASYASGMPIPGVSVLSESETKFKTNTDFDQGL